MKMTVVWDIALCGLAEIGRSFIAPNCLHHQGLVALIIEAASTSETSANIFLKWSGSAKCPRVDAYYASILRSPRQSLDPIKNSCFPTSANYYETTRIIIRQNKFKISKRMFNVFQIIIFTTTILKSHYSFGYRPMLQIRLWFFVLFFAAFIPKPRIFYPDFIEIW
jgi:hypothetical protein